MSSFFDFIFQGLSTLCIHYITFFCFMSSICFQFLKSNCQVDLKFFDLFFQNQFLKSIKSKSKWQISISILSLVFPFQFSASFSISIIPLILQFVNSIFDFNFPIQIGRSIFDFNSVVRFIGVYILYI